MTKGSGLTDRFYLDGRNLSGDIGAISEISGGPTAVDTTHITKNAIERIGTLISGRLVFAAYHNPTRAHPPLAALPRADVIATYLRGTLADSPCAGLIGRQIDYPGQRGTDGSLRFAVTVLSDGAGVEWGRGYVGGASRTDSSATNGDGVDDTSSSTAGMAAYLQVLAFTGTSATVSVQHSTDNGATDPYTTIITFAAVTAASAAQRMATTSTTIIKRWIRVITAGTFSSITFHVMGYRGVALGVAVAVDVQIFTSSGTWTKPLGVITAFVAAVGGGGGGGGGTRASLGVALAGGPGGGGGGYATNIFRAADLGATEAVTVAAGGAGGSGATTNDTPGVSGGNGGGSQFGTVAKVTANGGGGGVVNDPTSVEPGGGVGVGNYPGGLGGTATPGAAGGMGGSVFAPSAGGGGAGGGVNTAGTTAFAGGQGGSCYQLNNAGTGLGGAVGASGTTAGDATANSPLGGPGGGGGGGRTSGGPAGNGGNGGRYGGGGGGGGSCPNGINAGNGGTGRPGIVIVVSW